MKIFKSGLFSLLFFSVLLLSCHAKRNPKNQEEIKQRRGKLLSMFQVVKFPNNSCQGSDSKNGTCYSPNECEAKNGQPMGDCAGGYGVCCIFSVGCGTASAENSTFFETSDIDESTPDAGICSTKICKTNANICQLRLDFATFEITGPSSDTALTGKFNGNDITATTVCNRDSFTVAGAGGGFSNPPVICGRNSGEHMYVDMANECVELKFNLAPESRAEWSIQATQYSCDYTNLAPVGCTQWFFGEDEGTIQSFNYDEGVHLADQYQKICIRQELGDCRICYEIEDPTDFQISGVEEDALKGEENKCCGYGENGDEKTYDCLQIPGVQYTDEDGKLVKLTYTNFCGSSVKFSLFEGLQDAADSDDGTPFACTTKIPFEVTFRTDGFEFAAGDEGPDDGAVQGGFKLKYTMDDKCQSQSRRRR